MLFFQVGDAYHETPCALLASFEVSILLLMVAVTDLKSTTLLVLNVCEVHAAVTALTRDIVINVFRTLRLHH